MYRLRRNLSRAIRKSLLSKGVFKRGRSWERLVGYTAQDLREHLEWQFKPGMSWSNYGQWDIDHVIPKSAFEITSARSRAFRECWALANLRPMWGVENESKADVVDFANLGKIGGTP